MSIEANSFTIRAQKVPEEHIALDKANFFGNPNSQRWEIKNLKIKKSTFRGGGGWHFRQFVKKRVSETLKECPGHTRMCSCSSSEHLPTVMGLSYQS